MNPAAFRLFLSVSMVATTAPLMAAVGVARNPTEVLRAATDEVMAILYEKPTDGRPLTARVRPVMEKYFSFETLTRRAVGPGWRQFTPEQQRATITLLTELVIRTYCAHFDTVSRAKIVYSPPVELASNRREISTTLTHADESYAVSYRAELMPEGWRLYDIVVEGVSLVANYRAQLEALFQKGGADAIIQGLEQKLTETQATN